MAIDILSAFREPPPAQDFVLPGFLSGTVGALVAPGATGKSFWALEATMSVACSVAGGDLLGLTPQRSGPVLYLSAEDPEGETIRRLHAIGQHLKPEAQENIATNLYVEPIAGKRIDLMNERHLQRVIDYALGVGVSGMRLIVIDTLSRCHSLDENSNGDMARVVSQLEYLAAQTRSSVLFLHHIGKSAMRDKEGGEQHAARGASALIDNARWCGFVQKMSEAEAERLSDQSIGKNPIGDRRGYFLKFGVSKQNYGKPLDERWYQRHDGGVLLPVELFQASTSKGRGKNGGKGRDESQY